MFSDGCFAPADGSDPIPVIGFRHDLRWIGKDGTAIEYGSNGSNVKKLAGRVEFVLEGGATTRIDAEGTWCAPYEPYHCGGLNQMIVQADDGRVGTAIYEITGSYHYRYFNVARGENLPSG